jgi:hypothetical protein
MAQQIKPEDIERAARELARQEDLKRELQAAARLLNENQQAKDAVAGLAEQAKALRDEMRANGAVDSLAQENRDAESLDAVGRGARDGSSGGTRAASSPKSGVGRDDITEALAGKGREARQSGKLANGSGGRYLYLRTEAGRAAARVPYSSAYPRYRRDAERLVQRSQVPAAMRSMVRDYFDAINPDRRK